METNIVVDNSPPIQYLTKWVKMLSGPNSCQPIKLQDSLRCNISEKKQVRKFIIGMQINIKVFLKLILSFWVCATRHAQSNQNKKYA